MLRGESIKQSSFHPWSLPQDDIPKDKIPEDVLLSLFKDIVEGENVEESIQKIILGHMRLALTISGRYVSYYNCISMSEDLDSSALLGLTVGVNKLKNLKHSNVTGFLVLYIHQHLSECMKKAPMIYTPRGKQRVSTASLDSLAIYQDSHLQSLSNSKRRGLINLNSTLSKVHVRKNELLEDLTKDDIERKLANLGIEGYTPQEIAEMLGVSLSTIYVVRQKIRDRYNERQ